MNYYAIYDARSGVLLAEGNSLECKRKLGCSSMDTFYALVNRSRRGINHKYKVVIKKGGDVDYPVLGKKDPMYEEYHRRKETEGDGEDDLRT
ncbi:MAG: hypothetical protein IJD35_00405 [Clostridia bacterium]|nr:hypothetical protein [Clostridia bacterium]